MTTTERILASSFRDPSGFLFTYEGRLFRQVNPSYQDHYDHLVSSGLYDCLVSDGRLIPHEEVASVAVPSDHAYKILRPEPIPFISYPYEWCFSQLQAAALLTLDIQRQALAFGMSLKDASAYNVQFRDSTPLWIDTLSFERYRAGSPWVAYRQFCQHFLAPLALMSYTDGRIGQLSRVYVDGLPLDLASALLPWRTRLRFSLSTHLHLHAHAQRSYAGAPELAKRARISRLGLQGLIEHLAAAVQRLTWRPRASAWLHYETGESYTAAGVAHKQRLVAQCIEAIHPRVAWDLGANTGVFSRLASSTGIVTIAMDSDPSVVEEHYLRCLRAGDAHLLPLVMDLTNPSPGIGWAHQERLSLRERGPADLVLALALIHHLALSNHLTCDQLAAFLSQIGRALIIEFIPKNDPQAQRLLATATHPFADYTQAAFERAFAAWFHVERTVPITQSQRTLYLMRRR